MTQICKAWLLSLITAAVILHATAAHAQQNCTPNVSYTDGLPSPNCEGTQDNACTFSQFVTFTATFPDGSSPQAQILGFGGAGSGAICGPPPYYLIYPLPSSYYQPETNTQTTQAAGTGYATVWLTDYTPACVRWPCGIHSFCVFGVTTQQSGKSTLEHSCSGCPNPTSPNPGCAWCINNVLEGCPVWNTQTCSWQCQGVSPIIINIDGAGWDLTNTQNGVLFDFFGNGDPIQMAWTALGSHNAFLALDRNHNGVLDGPDLFGNITQQPPCAPSQCNGFSALAVFDEPANGGNGNGKIDPGDAIWGSLLLWWDLNHDGISQPNEYMTISQWNKANPSQRIDGIDLSYHPANYTDPQGNKFRFCSRIFGPGSGRITCDVFFQVAP